ncbi:hypothetical protein BDR07DRAFT_1484108 [Suillus spraguei]|nr:hypothetical protein BDR07DRAFT_1484108 [Suillus spraguei]
MSVAVAGTEIRIENKSSYTISVRITADNENGSTSFFDIKPGQGDTWARSNWQVAFVLRDSTNLKPSSNDAKTLVVRPGVAYTINDN